MPKSDSEVRLQLLGDEDAEQPEKLLPYHSTGQVLRSTSPTIVACLLLLVSLAFNIGFVLRGAKATVVCEPERTKWANLSRTVTTPFYIQTGYGKNGTQEARDKLWQDLDISGLVHIPHDWAQDHGLPRSQMFPWDRSQGIYYPAAFHQLHCLKYIYTWLSLSQKGLQPTGTWEHVVHCMDALMQDAYCHADDTPWYQPPPEGEKHGYQKIQFRQCRDWNQLLGWVKERYACYKHDLEDEDGDYLEHFHFCPEDSPYWEIMERHFERKAEKAKEKAHGRLGVDNK